MDNTLTSIADFFSSILQVPGEAMRNLVLMIPMPFAKVVFITYFVILIVWIGTLSKSETVFKPEFLKKEISLKPFAIFSLYLMIVIYTIF
ncbi:MAG: hypothetical protein VCD00_07995 [Candidatus Hydrogenedentota bacterium]